MVGLDWFRFLFGCFFFCVFEVKSDDYIRDTIMRMFVPSPMSSVTSMETLLHIASMSEPISDNEKSDGSF